METLRNIKEGDIFYTQFNKKYYFMQVIHITDDLPPPYDVDYRYGYFIVVFEKPYKELPEIIEELDLINIYKVKDKPKKTLLFISCWGKLPEIGLREWEEGYKKYSKYEIKYFGNSKVSEKLNPAISIQTKLPANYTENDDGIVISPTPAGIGYMFYIFEQDEKYKNKKIEKINPKYFKEWLDTVDLEIIIKIEKIVQKYENANENISKELKKCVNAINKLDENNNFIGTIEMEDIYNILEKISKKHGINDSDFEKVVEENREW